MEDLVDPREQTPGSVPRGPRAEQRRRTRDQFVEIARAMILRGKFHECSVDDIAKMSRVSRAAFYLHFKSKQDLLYAVLDDQRSRYEGLFNNISPKSATSHAGILQWLRRYIELFAQIGPLMPLYFTQEGLAVSYRKSHATRLMAIRALGHRIPALKLFGEDGGIDPKREMKLLLFLYAMENVTSTVEYLDGGIDVDAALNELADQFLTLVK